MLLRPAGRRNVYDEHDGRHDEDDERRPNGHERHGYGAGWDDGTRRGPHRLSRAELQINDAQTKLWDAYAAALRENAKRLKESGGGMMMGKKAQGLLNQLDAQEKMLGARLEGVKAMKAALAPSTRR